MKINYNNITKPMSNKNFGLVYTLILLAIVVIGAACFVFYFVGKFLYKLYKSQLKKHNEKKRAEAEENMRLSRFKDVEKKLFISDNTLYYTIRSYTNKNNKLTMYVDFYVKGSAYQYTQISDEIDNYLRERLGYGIPSYKGKSDRLKGSKLLIDMGQMYLEQSLTKAVGEDIKVEQLDPAFTNAF